MVRNSRENLVFVLFSLTRSGLSTRTSFTRPAAPQSSSGPHTSSQCTYRYPTYFTFPNNIWIFKSIHDIFYSDLQQVQRPLPYRDWLCCHLRQQGGVPWAKEAAHWVHEGQGTFSPPTPYDSYLIFSTFFRQTTPGNWQTLPPSTCSW